MEPTHPRKGLPVEFFDVVDDKDDVVGRKPGRECVRQGLLHRAIAILLFDERGAVYIQRRADWMGWYPGHWTLSVMGHVASGETYEHAAKRELSEELGIHCELKWMAKVKTPDWPYGDLVEREYLAVFEGRVMGPKITLSEETKEGKFVGFKNFVKLAKEEPDKLTPDTLLALDVYLRTAEGKTGPG
jgi:isopentenyl-diphosphate delta-isomerase